MLECFLNQLMQVLNENSKSSSENRVLVIDNAVIHKSSYIQNLISGKKIHIMFIPTYEPLLNPAEKLMLAIKLKLRMRQFQAHALPLATVKSVVNELAYVNLKKMITSSLSEALNKMKAKCLALIFS